MIDGLSYIERKTIFNEHCFVHADKINILFTPVICDVMQIFTLFGMWAVLI